jgi:hypothetical protein
MHAAWEYMCYTDGMWGEYDWKDITGLAASLITADLWRCWWD